MSTSVDAARATQRARDELERELGQARARRICARLVEIAATLRAAGARRVVLFGSLATGDASADSDLDLGVEGLPATRYFEVLAHVMQLAGCSVDLVRLEDAGTSLSQRIASEGREL